MSREAARSEATIAVGTTCSATSPGGASSPTRRFASMSAAGLSDGERTVVLARGEVQRGGETFAWGTVAIFRVADGRIAECWVVPHDQRAFDQIWASPAIGGSSLPPVA